MPIESQETINEYKNTQAMSVKHALNPKQVDFDDQLINYNSYTELYDAVSTKSKSPEKPKSKKITNDNKQVVNISPGKSVQSGKESKLDSSILSTKAFAQNAIAEDGLKRDSDAFVMASINQNQRKQKLEDQLKNQKKKSLDDYNEKLKKLQEAKEKQDIVNQELEMIYQKKTNKANPYKNRILKDSKINDNNEESNPFLVMATNNKKQSPRNYSNPERNNEMYSPTSDIDKENLDSNKFNTYNEFKLNHDEIMEEEFEEDDMVSHSNHDKNNYYYEKNNSIHNINKNRKDTEDNIDVNEYVHLVDKERSYTPPIKDLDENYDLYENEGGTGIEADQNQFNDSLVDANYDQQFSGQRENVGSPDDEEMLDLHYDPILDCYVDPKTNLYYEIDDDA
eukprot:Mrub_00629.p2 GENE.Mrub_00629~~Mrub_00629.p2  ORF type:complete len:395 (+),score=109.81 Mrub_00629:1716-2900(+)